MKTFIKLAVIFVSLLIIVEEINAYSKYGRKCGDIGCLNNEICVIKHDKCSLNSDLLENRNCGDYPTCEPAGQMTCANFDCLPGQQCQLQHGVPKCVPAHSTSNYVPQSQSNYPTANSGYPDGTTSRPRPHAGGNIGNGYQGGQPGSGYPGSRLGSGYGGSNTGNGYRSGQSDSGYPGNRPGSGYPGSNTGNSYPGGQPGSGYPGHTGASNYPVYNNNAYQGGYPGQNPYGGYQQYGGHQQQRGYYGNQQNTPPRQGNGGGNSLTDKISAGLKSAAGTFLQNALTQAIQNQFNQRG